MMSRISQSFFASASMTGPLFATALFVGLFAGVLVWAFVKRRADVDALARLPLDEQEPQS